MERTQERKEEKRPIPPIVGPAALLARAGVLVQLKFIDVVTVISQHDKHCII